MKTLLFLTEKDLADVFQPDQPNHDSVKIQDIRWHHFRGVRTTDIKTAYLVVFHNRIKNEFNILKNVSPNGASGVVARATAVKVLGDFCKQLIE
jgi:hypothetical protein